MKINIRKEVGRTIRKYRLKAGLTQMQLADRLGLTYQQIQKYEMGKSNITVDRLFQIASALKVSVSSLLDVKAPHKPAYVIRDEAEQYGDDDDIEKIVTLLRKISNKKITLALIAVLEEIEKRS